MSKEMMIIFVYDTECCKKEEDDPASAVVYFHPSWISDHQRLELVGQLMGTTHFLSNVFTFPKMITLESGKFAIRRFSRYILAIGTDRNISDWVIDHRADILCSLISIFHCNIDTICQITTTNGENNKKFKEKLYQIFETYLPILQYGGNTFSNAPMMQLPKSSSNVFLEAIQILQCCQDVNGVLGGVMFYHNKIVATQLDSEITKMLIMTDPYRIKCTAETLNVSFELPEGVQLLQVYVHKKEYNRLKVLSNKCRSAFENNNNKKLKKPFSSKPPSSTKEPVFTAMKRDKSIIFSTVPEEDVEQTSPPPLQNNKKKFIERPRSLSLFSTTADVINNEKKKVQTPFRSQASVCSTPLADKVLHGNVMSICCNPEEEIKPVVENVEKEKAPDEKFSILKNVFSNKKLDDVKRSLKKNISQFSRNVTMKYYGIGLKTMPTTPLEENSDSVQTNDNKLYHCTTITDPYFPVFGNNGMPISKYLYDTQVVEQLESMCNENQKQKDIESEDNVKDNNIFKNFDSDFKTIPQLTQIVSEITKDPNDSNKINENIDKDFKKRRHSLNLPLKSLTLDSVIDNEDDKKLLFSPVQKNLGGVQLTPLLSKLTILAMDEKSSGIGSRDTTPSENRDFNFDRNIFNINKKKENFEEINNDEFNSMDSEDLEKAALFICGQQNIVLMVLIEMDVAQDAELILKLWEICYNTLNQLESHLHQCIDPCSSATTDMGVDPYSYMCLDQKWDIVQRGGPWGVPELSIITHLHNNFMEVNNLCEIIVRNDDSIIYGYKHSQTELFYHQNSTSNVGLPTPADLMGTVPLKAKRRLERDHAIILL